MIVRIKKESFYEVELEGVENIEQVKDYLEDRMNKDGIKPEAYAIYIGSDYYCENAENATGEHAYRQMDID